MASHGGGFMRRSGGIARPSERVDLLNGSPQTAIIQLTPTALEQRLQGMTETLRSGETGKAREAIDQSVSPILVGVDGGLTIEAKPKGLLGLEGNVAQLECREGLVLLEPRTLATGDRQWKLIAAQVESHTASR